MLSANGFNFNQMEFLMHGRINSFTSYITHYQATKFRLFQSERVCRRQFQIRRKWKKIIQTGRKHSVGKGEIARYEQFLLFPQCFQKACFPGASKGVIVWEWDNTVVYVQLTWNTFHAATCTVICCVILNKVKKHICIFKLWMNLQLETLLDLESKKKNCRCFLTLSQTSPGFYISAI